MNILCCIPARYGSTRLEGKPLLKINGSTIISLVYKKAIQTICNDVIVLTDDQRIFDEINNIGGKCCIVSEDCLNGTERIITYLNNYLNNGNYDIIVNIQGDEPFVDVENVNKTIKNYIDKKQVDSIIVCSTMCFKTKDESEIILKSRGKVIVDKFNNITYCSRNVIPTNKKDNIIPNYEYNIHIGVFVYDIDYLLKYYLKENTQYQLSEDIEWLKIIEQGFKINTIFVEEAERGVDTIDDYNYLINKYK